MKETFLIPPTANFGGEAIPLQVKGALKGRSMMAYVDWLPYTPRSSAITVHNIDDSTCDVTNARLSPHFASISTIFFQEASIVNLELKIPKDKYLFVVEYLINFLS